MRLSDIPESANDDFLFHLYRGTELLQDNHVHEAKEELETALRLQPLDTKGQDLLAVVYFRLGMYPRAIQIFQELAHAYPNERTPRINLALCYLKTGQPVAARSILEETVATHPQYERGWAYLGLAYERLADYASARDAFLHAGQDGMARRMDELLSDQNVPASRPTVGDSFHELDEDAAPFFGGPVTASLRPTAASSPSLGAERPSLPASLSSSSGTTHQTLPPTSALPSLSAWLGTLRLSSAAVMMIRPHPPIQVVS